MAFKFLLPCYKEGEEVEKKTRVSSSCDFIINFESWKKQRQVREKKKKWSEKMETSKSSFKQKFTKRMQNAKIQDKTYLRVIIVSPKPEN